MLSWRRFLKHRQNVAGLMIIAVFALVALAAPTIAPPDDPDDPLPFKTTKQSFQRIPSPPSPESPLGTTPQIKNLPRFGIAPGQDASYHWDVFYTLVWGTRSAFRYGLTIVLATVLFGTTLGIVSGFLGGTFEAVTLRATDAFLAFPAIAAIWLFQRAFFTNVLDFFVEPENLSWWEQFLYRWRIDPIMLALIVFSWMSYTRLAHSLVSRLRREEYVIAARAMGASNRRIIFQHLLPNVMSPTIVLAARDIGAMVVLASAFIFIGFGGNLAWGVMLVSGRDYVIGLAGNPFAIGGRLCPSR
jgi:peptide/nickel transport system permease protein